MDETDSGEEAEMKILYKDSEAINSFCISKTIPRHVVLATMRDVQELDISNTMGVSRTFYIDENISPDSETRLR